MPYTKAFKELKKSVKETYLGRPVPLKYRKRYGKRYDLSEMKKLSYAIAKAKKIKIDK